MSSIDLGWAVNWKIPLWRRYRGGGANAWKREMTTLLPPLVPPSHSPLLPLSDFKRVNISPPATSREPQQLSWPFLKPFFPSVLFYDLFLSVIPSFPFGSSRSLVVRENRLKTFSSRVALELRGTGEVFQGLAWNDSAKKLTDFHEIFSTDTNKDNWTESKMKRAVDFLAFFLTTQIKRDTRSPLTPGSSRLVR